MLTKRRKIDFEFFEKHTRNKRVILENTEFELGEELRKEHLNNFMLKLKETAQNTEQKY